MSETIRSYSAGTHPHSRRVVRAQPRAKLQRRFVVSAAVFAAVYIYWIGRDTHPLHEFVPSERTAHVFVSDVIRDRHEVAASEIWKALPDGYGFQTVPDFLSRDFPLPEWMVRNLVGDVCHVSREHLDGPDDDLLVVTRMTRVGALLARLQWLVPGIKLDEAGGLEVYRAGDNELFFAIRGRTLIMSPSRRALIYSLTLTENERIDRSILAYEFGESERVTARGALHLEKTQLLGRWFDYIRFAVRVDGDSAYVRLRGVFRTDLDEKVSALLEQAEPVTLVAPHEGPVTISLDLSSTVRDLWESIGGLTDAPIFAQGQWAEWESGDLRESITPAITRLLGPAGPGLRMTWLGVDENELFPTPELLLSVDADPEDVEGLLKSLPKPKKFSTIDPPHAFYEEESRRLYAPTVSGPTLELTAGLHDDALLVSNSRTVAERYLSFEPSGQRYLRDKGNFFLSVLPSQCMREIQDTALLLADNQLLKNHTPETIRESVAEWRDRASIIDSVTVLASIQENALEVVLNARCVRAADEKSGD